MTLADIVRQLLSGLLPTQQQPVHREPSAHNTPEPSAVYFGPEKPATFTAILVPDKIFEDHSYKMPERRYRKVKPDWEDYFDSCAEDIGRAVGAVFGPYQLAKGYEQETVTLTYRTRSDLTFDRRRQYVFTTDRCTVVYEISGRGLTSYTPDPTYGGVFIQSGLELADKFFLDIVGSLQVQSSTLGRGELREFMSLVLNTHTPASLQSYTTSQQKEPLSCDPSVARLTSIGINPQTVARYTALLPIGVPRGYYQRVETGLAGPAL